jgi:hypothetical protein
VTVESCVEMVREMDNKMVEIFKIWNVMFEKRLQEIIITGPPLKNPVAVLVSSSPHYVAGRRAINFYMEEPRLKERSSNATNICGGGRR